MSISLGLFKNQNLMSGKGTKLKICVNTPLLQYIMFREAFHFSPLLFLNPGKTDSTTGLWVQQTQSSKRKPQTQQAQVSANIEQSNTLSFNGCLRQISCFSNRSQSCGLQQDLHHKNTLLLPPCLARLLRWSNKTMVSLQQRQPMLRFKDQTSLSCPELNTSQLSFKQG